MRLCQYTVGGMQRLGVALAGDQKIGDLRAGYVGAMAAAGSVPGGASDADIPANMIALISQGDEGRQRAELAIAYLEKLVNSGAGQAPVVWDAKDVRLEAPVTRPSQFFSIAVNNKQMMSRVQRSPKSKGATYFIKLHTTIIGPYDPIEIPDIGQVGSEVEMVAVIGKGGKNIPVKDALSHVYGYMLHNDVTAHAMRRDEEWVIVNPGTEKEERLTYPGRYKNIEKTAPLGPWLVTADELGDPQKVELRTWINDSMCMEGTTADHLFDVATLVSYLSEAHTLEPGDLISTGTVPAKAPWSFATIDYLKHGGYAESEGTGLGRQRNEIKAV